MRIEVKSYGHLRDDFIKRFGSDTLTLELEEKTSILRLIKILDISQEQYHIILVNGIYVNMQTELKDGDTVAIFPQIAGGLYI